MLHLIHVCLSSVSLQWLLWRYLWKCAKLIRPHRLLQDSHINKTPKQNYSKVWVPNKKIKNKATTECMSVSSLSLYFPLVLNLYHCWKQFHQDQKALLSQSFFPTVCWSLCVHHDNKPNILNITKPSAEGFLYAHQITLIVC